MKRKMKNLLVISLALALLLSCTAPAGAVGTQGNVKKDETVYVVLDETGNVKEQIVSDWLHSDTGFHNTTDKSSLGEIENLKSDTVPVRKNGEFLWNTDETDLYYQGKSEDTLPVSVKISYELDGKALSARELPGESGHLKMIVTLTNNETTTVKLQGKEREICTPFLTVCGVLLPADTYQNVVAEHGAVQTDSKNQLACFLALPGVKDSLSGLLPDGLQDMEELLLDRITLEADVKDFTAPTFLFAAAPCAEGLNLDLEELASQLNEVTDASQQLQDGTVELDDAVGELVEKLGEFAQGYSQFDEGVGEALSGAEKLAEGGGVLLANAGTLSEKSGELASGAAKLENGAAALSGQLNTQLVPALSGALEKKDALQNKMNALSGQLNSISIPDTSGLKSQLSAGVGQVFDGAAQGASKAAASAAGAAISQQLSGALSGVEQSVPAKSAEIVNTVQGADLQVVQQVLAGSGLDADTQNAILSGVQSGMGNTNPTLTSGVSDGIGAVLSGGLPSGNPITDEAAEQIAAAVCGSEQMQAARAQAVSQVSAAVPDYDLSSLNEMLGEFKGLASDASAMLGQVDQLSAALYDPSDPSSQRTVVGAANALAAGAGTLSEGTNALAGGASAFSTGIGQISAGADTLSSGLNTLADSSKTVEDSIRQFQTGGAELKDGTAKLKDGMQEFAEKAVQKLTDAVDPDSDLAKVLEEMTGLAENFAGTGKGENTEFSVKYVMRTGSFEEKAGEKQDSAEAAEPRQPETTFWDRFKTLFQ